MLNRPRIRELSLGELLDASFRLYRNNFLLFVKIAALIIVPYRLMTFLLSDPLAPLQSGSVSADLIAGFLRSTSRPDGSGWLSTLYSLLLQPLLTATLILTAAQCYQQQPASIGNNFKAVRGRLLSLIGASLLQGLLLILACLPILLVFLLTLLPFDSSRGLASFVLFVVPIMLLLPIYVGVRLTFTLQALMLEDRRAADSIDRSWQLTKTSWWRIAGFSLMVALLGLCITSLPVGAVVFSVSLLGLDLQLVAAIQATLSAVAEILALPFGIIAYTLMFFDLRIRNEGFDLEQHDLFAPRPDDGEYQPSPSM